MAHLSTAVPARRVGRPDLALVLGRPARDPGIRRLCAEYGLTPRPGRATARHTGVEVHTGPAGLITTVVLHFTPGPFTPYHGELPAGAGPVPRRAAMWSALGGPAQTGPEDRWQLRTLSLHARYAPDADHLDRLTLSLPGPLPRAA
ncbi:hypothetical protein [Symbioplanes lichenis]|uniref:hypothetical protein n=1 Tax=Symbioplanes lichenis TaxID=1629072 RepID=UPI00273834DD|nr:hypothetical protein [Actinoplanes lichenis]